MWPFKKKKVDTQPPEERWLAEFNVWLDDLQKIVARFPDHSGLENCRLDEKALRTLDDITDVYTEDFRLVLEKFVLKSEAFRRVIRR